VYVKTIDLRPGDLIITNGNQYMVIAAYLSPTRDLDDRHKIVYCELGTTRVESSNSLNTSMWDIYRE